MIGHPNSKCQQILLDLLDGRNLERTNIRSVGKPQDVCHSAFHGDLNQGQSTEHAMLHMRRLHEVPRSRSFGGRIGCHLALKHQPFGCGINS